MTNEQQAPTPKEYNPAMSFEERMAALKEQQSELSRGSWKRRKTKQGGKR